MPRRQRLALAFVNRPKLVFLDEAEARCDRVAIVDRGRFVI